MDASVVLKQKELDTYNSIKNSLSGLTLQEAYNAINAVKRLMEWTEELGIDNPNEFIF